MTARKSSHDSLERAAAAGPSHASVAVRSRDLEAGMSKQQKALRKRLRKGAKIQLGSAILAARVMASERRAS